MDTWTQESSAHGVWPRSEGRQRGGYKHSSEVLQPWTVTGGVTHRGCSEKPGPSLGRNARFQVRQGTRLAGRQSGLSLQRTDCIQQPLSPWSSGGHWGGGRGSRVVGGGSLVGGAGQHVPEIPSPDPNHTEKNRICTDNQKRKQPNSTVPKVGENHFGPLAPNPRYKPGGGMEKEKRKRKYLQKEILIWAIFGTQIFGFQTPPPPPCPNTSLHKSLRRSVASMCRWIRLVVRALLRGLHDLGLGGGGYLSPPLLCFSAVLIHPCSCASTLKGGLGGRQQKRT